MRVLCGAVMWLSSTTTWGCALPTSIVAFGVPFDDGLLPLDRQAVVDFFASETLRKAIMSRVDRERIAAPSAVENPTGLMNRLFLFLTHREVAFLIVRFGLLTGPLTQQSVRAIADANGTSPKTLARLELDALQNVALALRMCGSEDSWHRVRSLKVLRLSVNTEHLLFREGIISVEQLVALSESELALLRRFGPGRVREVREALTRYFGVSVVNGT